MSKKSFLKRISPKIIVSGLLIAAISSLGGVHLYRSKMDSKPQSESYHQSYNQLNSAKLRSFFTKVQKNPQMKNQYLAELGVLSPSELNAGYKTAVETFQYELAIDFYNMGAKDCFNEGSDILLIAINSGRLDLVEELLSPNYDLKLYHLNAARSLVNIEQSNWAYIYKKQDTDDLGYQRYLIRAQKLAGEIISEYKSQNPTSIMRYDTAPRYQEDYLTLHGENSHADFSKDLQETLAGNYKIVRAIHGTQRTPILVNEEGRQVGIIKSKNELLAEALDYDHFAGVPPAERIVIPDMGEVVVQKWIPNSVMATEFKREKEWNAEQLHHIRVLDIRLGNSDRNKGNVLISERASQRYIIPIDHDLIGHYIPNDNNWEASYLNSPFSPISKRYIKTIDLEKDATIMKGLGYKDDEILSMKLRTTLLKMAAEQNLTLKETDMLFRFYYYDFLEKADKLNANATEEQIREKLSPHLEAVSMTVQNPVQVWSLIGNNFELYL